jgi:gamma-glutamyl phosphate reductase
VLLVDTKYEFGLVGDQGVLIAAKAAARTLAGASTGAKNAALLAYARRLEHEGGPVLEANARDLAEAGRRGLPAAMQDRLRLDPKRLAAIAQGLREIAALPDPVGEVTDDRAPNRLPSAGCACRSASSRSSTRRART